MTGRLFADQNIRCIQISKNGPIVQGVLVSGPTWIQLKLCGVIQCGPKSGVMGTLIPSIRRSERKDEE